MNFAVACERVVLTGGLLRFDRVNRCLAAEGHSLTYVVLQDLSQERPTNVEVIDFESAAEREWDVVMVPGAGFSQSTIAKLSNLRAPNFGLRVQHVLNDQSRKEAFSKVNASFDPHIVIANNLAWSEDSLKIFKADARHVLLGGVDTEMFSYFRREHRLKEHWVVGGLANKNPLPLIEAISSMGDVTLKLFGKDTFNLQKRFADLVASRRLVLCGHLNESELREFYKNLDIIVMTELNAGWANLVAESMACGVPTICSLHGTQALAIDEVTALVLEQVSAGEIRDKIRQLITNPDLCQQITTNARQRIENYSWKDYTKKLLVICELNVV